MMYMNVIELPRRLLDTWNIAFERLFAEANTAEVEGTHEAARSAAFEAPSNHP